MQTSRHVRVERNRLRFAAAHMATFRGQCEALHGHNYDVLFEVEGELTPDSWVWDFGELKRLGRELAAELDHKFLLQRASTFLEIVERDDAWEIAFGSRRYVFPRADVYPLPVDNTTVERISEWLAGRLLTQLKAAGATGMRRLAIGVEEMPGQTGWYTVHL